MSTFNYLKMMGRLDLLDKPKEYSQFLEQERQRLEANRQQRAAQHQKPANPPNAKG
jgi:hypothetical protein